MRQPIQWPMATDPGTEAETIREVQALGCYKAPSSDELFLALFKDGGMELLGELQVPSSCGEPIIVPIFKRSLQSDCANHRGISPISITLKLFSPIILRKLHNAWSAKL